LNERGFTLLELTIALTLLALLSAVLFGSLRLAGRSTDAGESKVEAAASMRLAQDFLRSNLEAQHPLRMRKILEWPIVFRGTRDELRYAADLPPRVAGGGIWYYRLAVRSGETRRSSGRCPICRPMRYPSSRTPTVPCSPRTSPS
jgi:general secretion pathway protein J